MKERICKIWWTVYDWCQIVVGSLLFLPWAVWHMWCEARLKKAAEKDDRNECCDPAETCGVDPKT